MLLYTIRTLGSGQYHSHLVDMGDELLGAAEIQRAERTNKVVAVVPFLALLGENQA